MSKQISTRLANRQHVSNENLKPPCVRASFFTLLRSGRVGRSSGRTSRLGGYACADALSSLRLDCPASGRVKSGWRLARSVHIPRQPMRAFVLAMFVIAISAIAPVSCADEGSALPTDDALPSTAWYDSESGSLVPITVNERIDDSANRQSRWLPKPKKLARPAAKTNPATTPKTGGGTTTGTGLWGTDMTIGNLFGWMLLALTIAVTVGLIVYAFSKAEIELGKTKSPAQVNHSAPDQQMVERMKHLPAELRRTDVNLRTEAERLMNEHQFDQALILLYGHQLLMLDQAGSLRLTRGKTNGRYVRETRSADSESGVHLQQTVSAFERSYFGRHAISQNEFAALWESNQQLEQRLVDQQGTAA